MYTSKDKSWLKEVIQKKITEAQEGITELEDFTKPVAPDVAIGRISRIDAFNSKDVNETSLYETKEKLLHLQNALSNIDSSDFGKCARCENLIPFARMVAIPESSHCQSCSQLNH